MQQLLSDDLDALRRAMKGSALVAGDDGYDEARRLWNAAIDAHPAVIARCATSEDVAAAVTAAVALDLEIDRTVLGLRAMLAAVGGQQPSPAT